MTDLGYCLGHTETQPSCVCVCFWPRNVTALQPPLDPTFTFHAEEEMQYARGSRV